MTEKWKVVTNTHKIVHFYAILYQHVNFVCESTKNYQMNDQKWFFFFHLVQYFELHEDTQTVLKVMLDL